MDRNDAQLGPESRPSADALTSVDGNADVVLGAAVIAMRKAAAP